MKNAPHQQKHANRLAEQTSPYLLQHAENPVDWFPWGSQAFEKAKNEDKPIFLSIGYATCHWCHVMEKESFEDPHIAQILNNHFVSIKVDREERPDIDSIYMSAAQVMTGTGGWPLSVFLTPQGRPFYAGTYFPPADAFGRPGFERVLLALAEAWEKNKANLVDSAEKITDVLVGLGAKVRPQPLSVSSLKQAVSQFRAMYDPEHGGFGKPPKFPQPPTLSFLLRQWHRYPDKRTLEMVEHTLDAMARGGIYDQLGGGFHRYATDENWLTPHFEKMLYDQALLSRVYIEAFQVTGNGEYARVAREIFDYVLSDMTDDNGGFYSAEDADSEGREGWFYVWSHDEITELVGAKKAAIFNARYGVTRTGNFEEGKSILHIVRSCDELARQFDTSIQDIEKSLAETRSVLLASRANRPRPFRDDKIMTGSNSLMISSLAYGGMVFDDTGFTRAAARSAQLILDRHQSNGRLLHSCRSGRSGGLAFLDDYAFLICALIDLYEATFEVTWLAEARRLCSRMIDLFADADDGFYITPSDAEQLIMRDKPVYDSAIPSGNSAAAAALLRLGHLTADNDLTNRAWRLFEAFSPLLTQSPASMAAMLSALDFALGPAQDIVIAGSRHNEDTRRMLRTVQAAFMPNTVLILHEPESAAEGIEAIAPFVAAQKPTDGRAAAYICQDQVCLPAIHGIDELKAAISGFSHGHADDGA